MPKFRVKFELVTHEVHDVIAETEEQAISEATEGKQYPESIVACTMTQPRVESVEKLEEITR